MFKTTATAILLQELHGIMPLRHETLGGEVSVAEYIINTPKMV